MSPAGARVLSSIAVCGGCAALLVACPLPQPLPGVGQVDGGVTPPRFLTDTALPSGTVITYDPACPPGSSFLVGADVKDENPEEAVEARWFVDYDPGPPGYLPTNTPQWTKVSPPPADQTQTVRSFEPYPFPTAFATPPPPAAQVHVVEMVVSNGFRQLGEVPPAPLPNRAAASGFETQVYRWIFAPAAGGGCGP